MKKKIKKMLLSLWILLGIIIVSVCAISYTPFLSKNEVKELIVKDSNLKVTSIDNDIITYGLILNNVKYYEYLTINYNVNTNYFSVVLWGNRDNWKWNIKGDKTFSSNIMYETNKYKNLDLNYNLMVKLNNTYEKFKKDRILKSLIKKESELTKNYLKYKNLFNENKINEKEFNNISKEYHDSINGIEHLIIHQLISYNL